MDNGVLIVILAVICIFIVGVFAFSGNSDDVVNDTQINNTTDLNLSNTNDSVDNVVNNSQNTQTTNKDYKTQNKTNHVNDTTNNNKNQKQETNDDDIPRCISCGAPVQTYGIKCSKCASKNSGKSSSKSQSSSDSQSSSKSQSSNSN